MLRPNALALSLLLSSAAFAQPLRQHPSGASSPLQQGAIDGATDTVRARLRGYGDLDLGDLRAPLEPIASEVIAAPTTPTHDAPAPPVVLAAGARATWTSCWLDGDVEPVDIHPEALIPVQLTFARRDARVVALVTLARSGGAQRGMSYPGSRIITWAGDRYSVANTPGVEPDAQIALGDEVISVLSYARTDDENAPRPITLSRWTLDGHLHAARVELPGTLGLRMDSPLVAWRGGLAVVLGRPPTAPDDDRRSEALHFFDARGRLARAPLELTPDTRDDSLGTLRAGLASLDDGATLTVTWTTGGTDGGVWARRGITLSVTPAAERVSGRDARPFWAPQPTPWGVLYQRPVAGQEGPLAEVIFAPWQHAGTPLLTGRFWDPLVAWSNGGWISAGLVPTPPPAGEGTASPEALPDVSFTARDGSRNRSVGAPRESIGGVSDAVDVAIGATDHGAILGWIEPEADETPGAVRRVALARIACQGR